MNAMVCVKVDNTKHVDLTRLCTCKHTKNNRCHVYKMIKHVQDDKSWFKSQHNQNSKHMIS